MTFSSEQQNDVFDKTSGNCAYCEKQLAWSNYGREGSRGAWEVDHRIPLSRGGTDHLNNLSAACIDCNRAKGDMTAREFNVAIQRVGSGQQRSNFWNGVATVGALAFLWWLFFGRDGQRQ